MTEGILWFGRVSLPKDSELCISAYMYILIQATFQINKKNTLQLRNLTGIETGFYSTCPRIHALLQWVQVW